MKTLTDTANIPEGKRNKFLLDDIIPYILMIHINPISDWVSAFSNSSYETITDRNYVRIYYKLPNK